jgi:hypothetical protein
LDSVWIEEIRVLQTRVWEDNQGGHITSYGYLGILLDNVVSKKVVGSELEAKSEDPWHKVHKFTQPLNKSYLKEKSNEFTLVKGLKL